MRPSKTFEQVTALAARALRLAPEMLARSFCAAGPGQLDAVIGLRRLVWGDTVRWDDRAYLSWRYRFGTPTQGRGDCWTLHHKGELVGMLGTEDVSIDTDAGTAHALKIMDLAVDPRYAVHGLGGWMVMSLRHQFGIVMAIGSNANSRQLAERLFQRLPERRTWSLPVDLHRYLRRRIRPAPLAAVVSALAGLVVQLRRQLYLAKRPGMQPQRVQRFGENFRPLLRQARRSGEVWIAKTVEFLNWRLFDNPRVQHLVWATFSDGAVTGYIAVRQQQREDGSTVLAVIDWTLCAAHEQEAFRALCRQVADHAANIGADAVVVTAYHTRSERHLQTFGFIRRPDIPEFVGLAGRDSGTIARLIQSPDWYLTDANNDVDD